MVIIKIEELTFRTKGNETALIDGIDTSSDNCLCGKILLQDGEQLHASWDVAGSSSAETADYDLSTESTSSINFRDLKEAAIHLSPPKQRQ
ncbi:hypothetical protein ACX0KM_10635 [Pseudomonas promysalinigenes]